MANKLNDINQRNEAKKRILQYGGNHEMNLDLLEYFPEWLIFLSNPLNLQPGLPDLTLTLDFRKMDTSYLDLSFNENKASIRSLKFELVDFHTDNTDFFLEDSEKSHSFVDGKPKDNCRIKKWVFNLFLHSGLEELELPAIPELQELLNKHPTAKINWTPFTPADNTRY